ncbi:MAG: hypothetical protein JOS17DRAFT_768314 [Linnemannia elongata]|nr:MAG: hypothetical protein JOS17DRAFT_768314 [Linnemannia elongata]
MVSSLLLIASFLWFTHCVLLMTTDRILLPVSDHGQDSIVDRHYAMQIHGLRSNQHKSLFQLIRFLLGEAAEFEVQRVLPPRIHRITILGVRYPIV